MGRKLLSVLTPDSLSLSLSDGGNVPSQPIDENTLVLSPADLVALGARPVFVFRPGGVPAGNVYTDWPTMMADVVVQQGPKWIEIDSSIAPALVPAGVWNIADCTFSTSPNVTAPGPPPGFGTGLLTWSNGATATGNLLALRNIKFASASAAPVLTSASLVTYVDLYNSLVVSNVGAAPFFSFTANFPLMTLFNSNLGDGVRNVVTTAVTLALRLYENSGVAAHALAGVGAFSSLQDDTSTTNPTQDNGGTQTIQLLSAASRMSFTAGVGGNWQPVPATVNVALDQLAAPNVLAEVNAAPIGAAGTITYTSVATIAKKKSGKVRVSISISVTSSGIAGLDFRMYRDTVSGPNQLPPHGFESNSVALAGRFTCTLAWVDTLPDTAAHVYVMQVIADAGTVALANGDCAVVANEL